MKFTIVTKLFIFYTILISGLFAANVSFAQNEPSISDNHSMVELETQSREQALQIRHLENQAQDLKDNYKLLYEGAKDQNDKLSNQISIANYSLGLATLFLTVVGIFLAWYINKLIEKVDRAKLEVDTVKKAIDDNASELFKKLKREETMGLLERLREVPEDVSNIGPLLFSRDLLESDFTYLKDSYLKIKHGLHKDRDAESTYISLLMQHFPYLAFKDEILNADMVSNISWININHMFSRDVRYFIDQALMFFGESSVQSESNREVIKKLFFHFFKSKYGNNTDLRNYISKRLSAHGLKTDTVADLAKGEAPTEADYLTWIDNFFS